MSRGVLGGILWVYDVPTIGFRVRSSRFMDRESEDGGQKSEVRRQETGIRGQESEVRRQETRVRK